MNLVKDKWIPVSYENGVKTTVSLNTLFKDSEKISDFVLNPTERIGIFALIIAITHAALDGPTDFKDWYKSKSKIIKNVLPYLKKYQRAFNLFGEFSAFQMQTVQPKSKSGGEGYDKTYPQVLDKICYEIASGNNPNFFEKKLEPVKHDDSWIACQLFSYQSFDCGGTHSVATWNGESKLGGKGSFKSSPRLGSLHTLILEENMLRTIHMNLLNKELIRKEKNLDWGKPVWELIPTGYSDEVARDNLTGTYLGMLVPISRTIKIHEDGVHCVLGDGFTYDNYNVNYKRIPTTTIIESTKKGEKVQRYPLKLKGTKHPWRDLGSICSLKQWDADTETRSAPLALNNIYYLLDIQDEEARRPNFVIWTGQVNNEKSKIFGKSEWRLVIENYLLYNTETPEGEQVKQRPFDAYRAGVGFAEHMASKLVDGVIQYHKSSGHKTIVDKFSSRDKSYVTEKITINFWHTLDTNYRLLLEESLETKELQETEWYALIMKTARKTFRIACPTFSSKSIKAYVEGYQKVFTVRGEKDMKKGEIDVIAKDFVKVLLKHKDNREIMSKFKQLVKNGEQSVNSSVSVFPLKHMSDSRLREAYYITAFMFSHNPKVSYKKTFGFTMRKITEQYASYDSRFNALLSSFDRSELRKRLKSIIPIIAKTETPINYKRLFVDIYYWGDFVKREWGLDFWSHLSDKV